MKNEKAETITLLHKFLPIKYDGSGSIREHILEMSQIVSKLRTLKLELLEDKLAYLVLMSLPPQFSQFEVSYNCQKENGQ